MTPTHFLTGFHQRTCQALIAGMSIVSLFGCASSEPQNPASDAAPLTNAEETVVEAVKENAEPLALADTQPDSSAPTAAATAATPTSTPPQPAAVATAINIEVGMTYADARSQLLQQGWVAVEAPEPGPYGVERTLYDVGFTEVTACAGSGLGQCIFEFYHPERSENDGLAVITYGGSRPEIAEWNTYAYGAGIGNTGAVAAASNSTGAASSETLSEIPVAFQGRWMVDVADCSAEYTSEGRLVITSDSLKFYETTGTVQSITGQGDSQIVVTSELSSEGTTFTDTDTFQLSSDRTAITDVNLGIVRYRCPDA